MGHSHGILNFADSITHISSVLFSSKRCLLLFTSSFSLSLYAAIAIFVSFAKFFAPGMRVLLIWPLILLISVSNSPISNN